MGQPWYNATKPLAPVDQALNWAIWPSADPNGLLLGRLKEGGVNAFFERAAGRDILAWLGQLRQAMKDGDTLLLEAMIAVLGLEAAAQ